jgi:hypothetical protein
LSGGIGSSVGLSKKDEVLDACGLGTDGVTGVDIEDAKPISISCRNRGKVDVEATGVTRGEDGKGGGGRFKGLGGLTSVAQEVLNKSLREVESERGLVVVIFVCVGVVWFVFGMGALLGHVLIMTRTVTG